MGHSRLSRPPRPGLQLPLALCGKPAWELRAPGGVDLLPHAGVVGCTLRPRPTSSELPSLLHPFQARDPMPLGSRGTGDLFCLAAWLRVKCWAHSRCLIKVQGRPRAVGWSALSRLPSTRGSGGGY